MVPIGVLIFIAYLKTLLRYSKTSVFKWGKDTAALYTKQIFATLIF